MFVSGLISSLPGLYYLRVLGHGFPPPLNPAIEIFEHATCNLSSDSDSNDSWDLAYNTIAVISAMKPIHTVHILDTRYLAIVQFSRFCLVFGDKRSSFQRKYFSRRLLNTRILLRCHHTIRDQIVYRIKMPIFPQLYSTLNFKQSRMKKTWQRSHK